MFETLLDDTIGLDQISKQPDSAISPTQMSEPMTPSSPRCRVDDHDEKRSQHSYNECSVLMGKDDDSRDPPASFAMLIDRLETIEALKGQARCASTFLQDLNTYGHLSFVEGEYDRYFTYFHNTRCARECLENSSNLQRYFTMATIHPRCHSNTCDRRAFLCTTPGCTRSATVPNVKAPFHCLQQRLVDFQATTQTILPLRCRHCWLGRESSS